MYGNPYYEPYQDTNQLEHFGVIGMKWGVRRYQNTDGTLTTAGKKRYGTTDNLKKAQEKSAARKQQAVKIAKTAAKTTAKAAAIALVAGVGSYTGSALAARGTRAAISVGSQAISELTKSDRDSIMTKTIAEVAKEDNPFKVSVKDVTQLLSNYDGDPDVVVKNVVDGYIPKDVALEALWKDPSVRSSYTERGIPESIAEQMFMKNFEEDISWYEKQARMNP